MYSIRGNELWDMPCARQSPWGKLLDRRVQILLIGVDLRRNTFIHGVEEWADIPGRLTDTRGNLCVILEDSTEIRVLSRRHHGERWSEHFWKVDETFVAHQVMTKGKLGDADVRVCEADKVTELLFKMLEINPNLFSNNKPLKDNLYKEMQVSK